MMKMAIEEESEGSQKNWLERKTTYAHTADVKRLIPANVHYICISREIITSWHIVGILPDDFYKN